MVLYCASLILLLIRSIISQSDGIRGFYNNIQIASGSSIVFPNLSTRSSKNEIPLDMLLRMNEVADTRDFIKNFIYTEIDNATLTKISSKSNYEVVERSGVITKAKMAVCTPELQTVPVNPETDSRLYYHPSCIRVERCGGCCAHNLLTCTPADSEIINVGVIVAEYKGGQRLNYKDYKIIPIEKHTKCKCDCKIQPQDCTKSQRYNRKKCSCECNNTDAERKCNAESNKIWSNERCSCLCRELLECTTGFYFDMLSCRCEVEEGRVRPGPRPWIA